MSVGGLLVSPIALVVAPGGELLVYDEVSGLLRIDPVTGAQERIVERPTSNAYSMMLDGNGVLWLLGDEPGPSETGFPDHVLYRIDLATAQVTQPDFEMPFAGIYTMCIAAEPAGTLLLGDCWPDPDHAAGAFRLEPATGESERFERNELLAIGGLATVPGAGVFATTHYGGATRVVRIDAEGIETVVTPLAWSGGPALMDEHRRILLAMGDRVVELDPFSGTHRVLTSFPSDAVPNGVVAAVALAPTGQLVALTWTPTDYYYGALTRDGAIIVLDRKSDRVVRVDPETGAQELLGPAPDGATHLALDRADRPLLANADGVFRLEPDGSHTLVVAAGDLGMFLPAEITLAPGLALLRPACDDGFDNDGDGAVDWPADPQCASADRGTEASQLRPRGRARAAARAARAAPARPARTAAVGHRRHHRDAAGERQRARGSRMLGRPCVPARSCSLRCSPCSRSPRVRRARSTGCRSGRARCTCASHRRTWWRSPRSPRWARAGSRCVARRSCAARRRAASR